MERSASSKRDATVEDEVFRRGQFADLVFRLHGAGGELTEVYGHAAMFSLLSAPLRALLTGTAEDQACLTTPSWTRLGTVSITTAQGGMREVHFPVGISAAAFRQVARYVYRLEPEFSNATLAEVLYAARALALEELEEQALAWGFANISVDTTGAAPHSKGEVAGSCLEYALACLDCLCSFEPRPAKTSAWRESLLQTFPVPQLLGSPAFFSLSLAAVRELLEGTQPHEEPIELWRACVAWARAHAGQGEPIEPLSPGSATVSPTRTLFGTTARLKEVLSPALPDRQEVGWQEPLVTLVEPMRFCMLSPTEFASQVECLDPMLPQLRQAIYAARRRSKKDNEGDVH